MDPTPSPPRQKRLPRILLGLGAALMVLLAAGLFLLDRALRGRYEPQVAELRKDITDHVDVFCDHQILVAKDPWFHERRSEGDAGPLLNAWLPWYPKTEFPEGSPLAIPAHLPQQAKDFDKWLESSVDVSSLDFSWMEKLHAYDRWDLTKNTPVEPRQGYSLATASLPEFFMLQLWAKFRLLHGLRTGQPLQAAKDVRQLAWLLYRSDTLIGGALAFNMLNLERLAHQSMKEPPPEWQPMSYEQVERLRLLVRSSYVFSNIVAPAEVAKRTRRCGEPAVTRCIAMAEAAYTAKLLKPLAQAQYAEAYAALEADLSELECPTGLARMIWELGETIDDENLQTAQQPEWMRRLPRGYAGPHITGIVLSDVQPSFSAQVRGLREVPSPEGSQAER
jgi:hypothetical protein